MSRASLLVVIGVLVMLAPFSGLPLALRTLIGIGLGAVVVSIGVALRSKEQQRLVALQGASAPAEPAPAMEPLKTPRAKKEPPAGVSPI